jgi:hypothetical protein
MNNRNSKKIKIIQPDRAGALRALPGRKAGTSHGRQRRDVGRGQRGGAADDGWSVLVARLGQRRKLEGASGHAPGRVSGGGAHPSGVPVATGRSLGGRSHTSTADVEVVAGGDPDEVLQLGGGYAIVRTEPIQKRRHGCGAHRGGKWWWRFGANPVMVAAL